MTTHAATDALEARLAALPWWRRPRPLRRQLAWLMAFVVLVSVILVAALNFLAARNLLLEGTRDQLVGVGAARTRSIEDGATRILARTGAVSSDLATSAALDELIAAFDALDDELTPDQEAELERFYAEQVVEPLVALDVDVTLDDVLPSSPTERYLQYHYTLGDPDVRADVGDAGDGSEYSAVHAEVHPYLSEIASVLGARDILLVSEAGDVVYSLEKRIDLGTNLRDGPFQDTMLADALTTQLPLVRTGEAVLSDIQIYVPGGAEPTLFAASAVRSDTEVLGAVVVEIPIAGVNALTTAEGRWADVGLEDGETYIVGTDTILRSESREWIEDPEGYLDRVDDEVLRNRIETLGSPVGLQPVDTEAVTTALEGEEFVGETRNFLGERTFTSARPIDVAGVDWVVVADVPLDEARDPLIRYLVRIGIALAILVPLAALLGALMAGRLTRPVPPVLQAAEAVAAGDRDLDLPDFGRNEFGDLAHRLTDTAHRLGRQEAELEAQYEETRAVLLSALPPRVVSDDRTPSGTGEAVDLATAVWVAVEVGADDLQVDETLGQLYASVSREAERLAAAGGLERVRAAADRHLFVAGLGVETSGADAALAFAAELSAQVPEIGLREGVRIQLRIGVSTGLVETGLLRLGNLSFTAWGEPVRNAMVIGTMAEVAVVGVDASTVEAATTGRWNLEPAAPTSDPEGRPIRVFSLVEAEATVRSDSTVG